MAGQPETLPWNAASEALAHTLGSTEAGMALLDVPLKGEGWTLCPHVAQGRWVWARQVFAKRAVSQQQGSESLGPEG